MRLLHSRHTGRRGFTLIELLVVIAIIGVLVSLTTAAVVKLLGKGPELVDRTDVSELTDALQKFNAKQKFYPPSRIFLANKLGIYQAKIGAGDPTGFYSDSLKWLNRMFPRLNWAPPNATPLDWSGGLNKALLDNTGVILEGDQCLVFFLGGMPQAGSGATMGTQGFSTNPQYPTLVSGERFQYYNFKTNRLVVLPGRNNRFPSYQNAHENTVYAYFSSYNRQNGYNPYGLPTTPGAVSDCDKVGTLYGVAGLWPYAETWQTAAGAPPTRYVSPQGFQLISAGPDGKFGPGTTGTATVWTAAAAYLIAATGRDDIANFHSANLGVVP